MSAPNAAESKHPFDWFQGKSVRDLYDRLSAAGPDTARLEVRTDGNEKVWLRVVPKDEVARADTESPEECGDINDSRRCPPICP